MTQQNEKMEFEITIWYFKPSGKFYTEDKFKREFRVVGAETCYMPDVVRHIKGLRDNGGQRAMYGLSDQNNGWNGPIVVNCEQGYPCLILPPESKNE